MINHVFFEITLVVVIAVIVSAIMRFLKQPLIIGYIFTGILVSPLVFNVIKSQDAFPAFAQLGVAILLFMVGIHLNPKVIKDVGKISLITGLGQVVFTSIIGFFISRGFGFDVISSLYIAIALTFSSTIIIMKLLSDKGDIDTLYGKISVGFLIVQDIVAMFILLIVSSNPGNSSTFIFFVEIMIKLVAVLVFVYLFSKLVFPLITRKAAKSQEFLLFFSIGWCLLIASIFAYLNFSIEAGALLAGVALSMSPFKYEISSKLKPLRDFFLLLFFVVLGSQMVFTNIGAYIVPIILFSLFILIGNPLIVVILMGRMGYTSKNSFFAGLTVAQISEFSLILVGLGVSIGHLSGEILSFVTIIGVITIAGSTYFIMYNQDLYRLISPILVFFERKGKKKDSKEEFNINKYDIILFGYNRIGFDVVASFLKKRKKFLVVDSNPDTVFMVSEQGLDCKYGDADNLELLNELAFDKIKMLISTVPEIHTNMLLVKRFKEKNKDGVCIVVANQIDDALALYDAGATYVIMPHMLGGKQTSEMIEKYGFKNHLFLKEKISHLRHIEHRKKYYDLGKKNKFLFK